MTHRFLMSILLPPCRVSTQWLGSSKWLARGGRRSRCVHFCEMHSQCLPKTVGLLMSHASLGMQQQLLCQYCHGQCAFLTCMCFREDKESTCCWPWQVPSVLVGLDAQSFHIVQFTFRPLNECRGEFESTRCLEANIIPKLWSLTNNCFRGAIWQNVQSKRTQIQTVGV